MLAIRQGPSELELWLSLSEGKPVNFTIELKGEVGVRVDSLSADRDNDNGKWWDITGYLVGEAREINGSYATSSKNDCLGAVKVHTHD